VAALKKQPDAASMAPAFSYARAAVGAGVSIPSIITMNSPHFGSPTYDIAFDPATFTQPVLRGWGQQFADAGAGLRIFQVTEGAGAIQVLSTQGHAKRDPRGWDARQVGVLDGVALTLMAGDFCGQTCTSGGAAGRKATKKGLRTDGTVPVYSQLMQRCPSSCPTPSSRHPPRRCAPAPSLRGTKQSIGRRPKTWMAASHYIPGNVKKCLAPVALGVTPRP
jgi:hypothetical protein